MQKIGLLLLLSALIICFGSSGCKGKTPAPDKPTPAPKKKVITPPEKADKAVDNEPVYQPETLVPETKGKNLRIISVDLDPINPTKDKKMTVKTEISNPQGLDYTLKYVFWVNAEKVGELEKNTFQLTSYKKNDYIFADVILMVSNKKVHQKRSGMTKIVNSPPEIKDIVFPKIEGPGTYEIKVKAEDVDQDTLVYSLEGKKIPPEISLDSATGIITLVTDNLEESEMKFVVVVNDDDKTHSKKEVTIKYKPKSSWK